MAQVVIYNTDGSVMFSCRGGEAARVSLPEAPSAAPLAAHTVATGTVPPSYAAVQKEVDDLHTKTMDFFSSWLKTGNAGGNTTIAGSTSTLSSAPEAPAAGEEDEDDGGALDLDTEGGALTDAAATEGKRPAGKVSGGKTARK